MDPRWGRWEIPARGQAGRRGRAACWRVGSPLSWWGLSSSCFLPISPPHPPPPSSLSLPLFLLLRRWAFILPHLVAALNANGFWGL